VAAATTGDCEPVISVDYEELETLADSLAARSSVLFGKGSTITPPATGKRLLSALKTATLLLDWTRSGDADAVALEFGCYPFEISRLKDSIERILMAMASVQRLLDPEVEGEEEKPKSPCLRRIELLRQMIRNGLEAEAASLTLVDGIGSVWARKLITAGIRSLQELSSTPSDKVVALGGVSEKRVAAWISDALLHASTDALGDAPCRGMVAVHPSTLQLGVDPYRLRRAVELKVITKSLQEWMVSGGLDPHLVGYTATPISNERLLSCDCPDHAKGHTCKHILAVRLAMGDMELSQAVLVVDEARQETFLDLFHLWFSR